MVKKLVNALFFERKLERPKISFLIIQLNECWIGLFDLVSTRQAMYETEPTLRRGALMAVAVRHRSLGAPSYLRVAAV